MDVVVLVPGGGGGGEDRVPDYGFGGGLGGAAGVYGFEVEEDLFGVPVEEGGEVWHAGLVSLDGWMLGFTGRECTCVEVELDVCVLLLLVAVVVWSALDDLHVAQLDVCAGRLGRYEAAERNHCGNGEGDGGEEAEDILQAHQCRMHIGGIAEG